MTGQHNPKDGRRPGFRMRIEQNLLEIAPNFSTTFYFEAKYGEKALKVPINPTHQIKFSLRTRNPQLYKERMLSAHEQFNALIERMKGRVAPLEPYQVRAYAQSIFDFYGEVVSDPRWKVDNISTLHSFHTRMNEVTQGLNIDSRKEYYRYRNVLPFAETDSFNAFFDAICNFDDEYMTPLYYLKEEQETNPDEKAIFYRTAAITRWWLALKKLALNDFDVRAVMKQLESIRLRSKYVGFVTSTDVIDLQRTSSTHTRSENNSRKPTIKGAYTQWESERNYVHNTSRTWEPVIDVCDKFFESKPVDQITRDDIIRWKDDLLHKQGKSPENVKLTYLKVLSVILNYARMNNWIDDNPLRDPVMKIPTSHKKRKRPYSDNDVGVILKAALEFPKENRLRWLSWILASTGARVTEITSLGTDQIVKEDGLWLFNIRESEDGGTIKTDSSFRRVPIHQRLIDDGLFEFINGKRGPIFYRPKLVVQGKKHPSASVASNNAQWIRKASDSHIHFTDKQPNHAFRKWFRTHHVEINVLETITDRIVGHRLPGEREDYIGRDMLVTMKQAVNKIDFDALISKAETRPEYT